MSYSELSRSEKLNAIVYGTIVGLVSVGLSIYSIYYTHGATSYNELFAVSTTTKIIGSIFLPVLFVYFLKRKNGAQWTFSTALKSIFILLSASIIVSSVGITIHEKTMDKITLEESYQNLINLKIVDMEDKGAPEKDIDQQIEIIEAQKEFALSEFSFRNATAPIFISLLLNFIFAMLLAFLFRSVVKKTTPVSK